MRTLFETEVYKINIHANFKRRPCEVQGQVKGADI